MKKHRFSEELYQKNYDLLFQRFPKIAFLTNWFSTDYEFCRTSQGELNARKSKKKGYEYLHNSESIAGEIANWQKTLSLQKVEVLYLYGLGLGYSYLSLKSWLAENAKRELIILEDKPAHLLSFLYTDIALDLLENERVHLHLFFSKEKKTLLEELAKKFPVKRVEVVPASHRRHKKVSFFSSMRLQILRETTLSEGLFIDRLYSYIPFANSLENLRSLPASFEIHKWKNAFKGIPAILCGAGPFLKEEIPYLKECESRALIIAAGSAIAALTSQNVSPHLGVMVDPNTEEYHRLKASFGFEIPMIYHLRTKSEVFNTFNGPIGYMRSAIASLADCWMEEKLGIKGSFIGKELSRESLSVTSLCLSLSVFLGCNPIILCGVDLSYAKGKRYADGVVRDSNTDFEEIEQEMIAEDRIFQIKTDKRKSIHTNVKWIMESDVLAAFARKCRGYTFFNASLAGLPIKRMPYRSLSELLELFPSQHDLRGRLYAKMHETKTKCKKEEVENLIDEIHKSLIRSFKLAEILEIESLRSLDSGKMTVAYMDLQEEIAYQILFYDTLKVLSHYIAREKKDASKQEKEHLKYSFFCTILQHYLKLFQILRPLHK